MRCACESRKEFHDDVLEPELVAATIETIPNDGLKPMIVCVHPEIDARSRNPLMLQTVLRLDAETIARVFCAAAVNGGQVIGACKDQNQSVWCASSCF